MMLRTIWALALLQLIMWGSAAAHAGDGFPPNGAWAYGSRPWYPAPAARGVGLGRHYTYRSYGYGYGWSAGWAYPSVRYRYAYPRYGRCVFPVAAYRSPLWVSYRRPWGCLYPTSFYTVRPYWYRVSVPVQTIVPVTPVCTVTPNVVWPSVVSATSTPAIGTAIGSASIVRSQVSRSPVTPAPVTVDSAATPNGQTVHRSMRDVADAMLNVGGYDQAAQAYARLSVMQGTDAWLLGRRLTSYIAAGDMAQADTVMALIEVTNLSADQLMRPGELKELLSSEKLKETNEMLAARVLADETDLTAIKTTAYWMQMQGNDQLARLFNRRSIQLAQTAGAPTHLLAGE